MKLWPRTSKVDKPTQLAPAEKSAELKAAAKTDLKDATKLIKKARSERRQARLQDFLHYSSLAFKKTGDIAHGIGNRPRLAGGIIGASIATTLAVTVWNNTPDDLSQILKDKFISASEWACEKSGTCDPETLFKPIGDLPDDLSAAPTTNDTPRSLRPLIRPSDQQSAFMQAVTNAQIKSILEELKTTPTHDFSTDVETALLEAHND